MHIGGLTIVEGPPPAMEEFLEQIRQRLHLVPRYRHKLAYTALDSGRPVWVDDPNFNLEYHVRHTALPTPGDLGAAAEPDRADLLPAARPLQAAVGDVADRGPRGRPLRADHQDPPLADRRHRGRGPRDGAVRPLAGPAADPALRAAPGSRTASRARRSCVAAGLRGAVRAGVALAEGALDALTHPERALARAREAAEGIGEIVWAGLNPAPETPLNVPIGPHRRFVGVAAALEDFKTVKNAFGGTVNDVVLAVVAGALRAFLISRGRRTEGVELRALVPVSVRTEDEHGTAGNRIVVMRGPLPVYIADPLQRLRFVSQAMDGLKESKQALGAEVIAGAQNFAPPTILAQASRLNFSTRLFNLIVTNVPGPQFPLYVLGREMLEADPGRLPARKPRAGDRDHVLQRPDELRPARRLRRPARHRPDRREHPQRTRGARRAGARHRRRHGLGRRGRAVAPRRARPRTWRRSPRRSGSPSPRTRCGGGRSPTTLTSGRSGACTSPPH